MRRTAYSAVAGVMLSVSAGTVSAVIHDFQANYQLAGVSQTADFRLWVPDDVPNVRGLIYLLPGSGNDWRPLVDGRASFQAAAGSLGFGVISTRAVTEWGDSPDETAMVMQSSLDAAASASGHTELSNAPISLIGFSLGGYHGGKIVQAVAPRVISFVDIEGVSMVGENLSEAALHTPGLFIDGEEPAFSNLGQWTDWRSQGGQVSYAVTWGRGHEPFGSQVQELAWTWTGDVIRKRYPTGQPLSVLPNQPASLIDLDTASGWLGQVNIPFPTAPAPSPFVQIAPADEFTGDSAEASWLPGEDMAKAYRAFTSEKRPPLEDGSPRPYPRIIVPGDAFDIFGYPPGIRVGDSAVVWIGLLGFDETHTLADLQVYDGDELLALEQIEGALHIHTFTPTRPGIHILTAVTTDALGNQASSFRTVFVEVPEPSTGIVFGLGILLFTRVHKTAGV